MFKYILLLLCITSLSYSSLVEGILKVPKLEISTNVMHIYLNPGFLAYHNDIGVELSIGVEFEPSIFNNLIFGIELSLADVRGQIYNTGVNKYALGLSILFQYELNNFYLYTSVINGFGVVKAYAPNYERTFYGYYVKPNIGFGYRLNKELTLTLLGGHDFFINNEVVSVNYFGNIGLQGNIDFINQK